MWLGILGPLRCEVDGIEVDVPGPLDRALLAALASHPRTVVSIDELADALWGADPPPAYRKVVRNRVSGLRARLGADAIATVGYGYRIGDSVAVDAEQFEQGSALSVTKRLALWRGDPLVELIDWQPARARRTALMELRAGLQDGHVEHQLDTGDDASSLVAHLEELVAEAPYRERRWSQLMRALYLAGRQRDALVAYQRARRILSTEVGLEPGPELQAMERAILLHDQALGRATFTPPPLLGREEELAMLARLVEAERVVTIVGLGGVGKSTLALELLRRRPPSSFVVDLSELESGAAVEEVAGVAARALQVAVLTTAPEAVVRWAHDACGIVLLDNCEHVATAAGELAVDLAAASTDVTVIATSRMPLGHGGEVIFRLGPLDRPAAIELFRARSGMARAVTSTDDPPQDSDDIDRLCAALSDIPLAIELVAARSTILSPADLLDVLKSPSVHVVRRTTGPRRQRSVADVVGWTTDALSTVGAAVFRRAAVFAGGFTLDAAVAVLSFGDLDADDVLDGLTELASASLLVVQRMPTTRYRYLDLVSAHAGELLEGHGDRMTAQARFVEWAASQAEGTTYDDLDRLVIELPNLLAAARLAADMGLVGDALRIVEAGVVLEGAERFEMIEWAHVAVELPGAAAHPKYARACSVLAGDHIFYRPDRKLARRYADAALAADPEGVAGGWAHHAHSILADDPELMRQALRIAIEQRDPFLEITARSVIALQVAGSDPGEAWCHAEAVDQIATRDGRPWTRVMATMVRGMSLTQVDPDLAVETLARAASLAEAEGLTMFITACRAMAGFAGPTRDPATRIATTRASLVGAARSGNDGWFGAALALMARAFGELGRPERAELLAAAAKRLSAPVPVPHGPDAPLLTADDLVELIEGWARDDAAAT